MAATRISRTRRPRVTFPLLHGTPHGRATFVPVAPLGAVLYLATHTTAVPGCIQVKVDVLRRNAQGRELLATEHIRGREKISDTLYSQLVGTLAGARTAVEAFHP